MPGIKFTDRTINFTKQDFADPLDVKLAVEILGGIMLFPENLNDSFDYILGSTHQTLKAINATPEKCREIATRYPDFLWHIIHRGHLIEKKFNECWKQPRKGHNRFGKGLIAGALTELLCTVGYNMSEVYNFIGNSPGLLNLVNNDSEFIRFPGKRKTLESIWNTYKHVAHLWWAYNELGKIERVFLFHDIQCGNVHNKRSATLLNQFLEEATLYRDILVEKRDPTADENSKIREDDCQIKDPKKLWLLLNEGRPFQKPRLKEVLGSMPIKRALSRKFSFPNDPQHFGPLIRMNPLGEIEINPKHVGSKFLINDEQVFFRRRIS